MTIETYTTGANGIKLITKTPNSTLTYGFLWGDYLALTSDSLILVNPTSVTADAGITIISVLVTGTTVQVTLSGGTLGQTYKVNCQIKTVSGQVDDRSILIKITTR